MTLVKITPEGVESVSLSMKNACDEGRDVRSLAGIAFDGRQVLVRTGTNQTVLVRGSKSLNDMDLVYWGGVVIDGSLRALFALSVSSRVDSGESWESMVRGCWKIPDVDINLSSAKNIPARVASPWACVHVPHMGHNDFVTSRVYTHLVFPILLGAVEILHIEDA